MGQALANLYFEPVSGKPNLRYLTLSTGLLTLIYLNTFWFSLAQVSDEAMTPMLRPAGFPFSDTVFYHKFLVPGEKLQNKLVALRDPYGRNGNRVVFRRVIAVEDQWVQRADDGGIIKIPKGHVWVECENDEKRSVDSLCDEIGGPISTKFVQGTAESIVWPVWRRSSIKEIDKFKVFRQDQQRMKGQLHSKVYSNQEIFQKYGIR